LSWQGPEARWGTCTTSSLQLWICPRMVGPRPTQRRLPRTQIMRRCSRRVHRATLKAVTMHFGGRGQWRVCLGRGDVLVLRLTRLTCLCSIILDVHWLGACWHNRCSPREPLL
jgi:hypothetical protein